MPLLIRWTGRKEKTGWSSLHKEGHENAQWVLMDYGSVVVHVFQKEYRDFYRLEDLWADGIMEGWIKEIYR
jgi:ribosome silencing factor RsfS/YbeB/iojap